MVSVSVPRLLPTMKARTTKVIQPMIAVLRWLALQRPTRRAMFRDSCIASPWFEFDCMGASLLSNAPPNIGGDP